MRTKMVLTILLTFVLQRRTEKHVSLIVVGEYSYAVNP